MSHQHHITEYRILTDSDVQKLAEAVQTAIHNGWQPWGEMTATGPAGSADGKLAQAVVKYSEWFR